MCSESFYFGLEVILIKILPLILCEDFIGKTTIKSASDFKINAKLYGNSIKKNNNEH